MNPFDQAWTLLKMTAEETRQTELGEFGPDLPSSYGPITHYHGTTVGPAAAINTQGLQTSLPYEAKMNQAQIAARIKGEKVPDWFPEGVYASPDEEGARQYASWRGQDRNQSPSLFGIRGGDLETGEYEGNQYFNQAIPRSRLVPIPLNESNVRPEDTVI